MILKWAEGIVDGLSYYNSFFCQPCMSRTDRIVADGMMRGPQKANML